MEATILIVEDSADLGKLFDHMLRSDGYEVIVARGWQDGQTVLAAGARPDLIIFDWMLTNTAGFLWADELRTTAATRHIPILFVCGDPPPRGISELLGTIGIPVIEKPFDIFVFRRRVQALLTPRERMAGAPSS